MPLSKKDDVVFMFMSSCLVACCILLMVQRDLSFTKFYEAPDTTILPIDCYLPVMLVFGINVEMWFKSDC